MIWDDLFQDVLKQVAEELGYRIMKTPTGFCLIDPRKPRVEFVTFGDLDKLRISIKTEQGPKLICRSSVEDLQSSESITKQAIKAAVMNLKKE